ncbi:unnamed protein product [Schistosoma turkestanicum]|nr:unnamed protein product [Schistosoma turkestanicum]
MYHTVLFYFTLIVASLNAAEEEPAIAVWGELERTIANVEKQVKILKNDAKIKEAISELEQKLSNSNEQISKYVKCINEHEKAQSYSTFITISDYSNLKKCFENKHKEIGVKRTVKSHRACKNWITLSKEDTKNLDTLIFKKHNDLFLLNALLFDCELYSRNVIQTINLFEGMNRKRQF